MADDIVERLRSWASPDPNNPQVHQMHLAADEIERLRAENKRLTDENARAWNACSEECEQKERLQALVDAQAAGATLALAAVDILDALLRRRQPGLTAALDGWDAATKEDDRG